MVKLLKFTEIWKDNNRDEHPLDLFINADSIDSIETINSEILMIHTKAGEKYKIDKESSLKIINELIAESGGVA